MKAYKLHWLDGKQEIITGNDIADAMNNAGYTQGVLRALDYYSEEKEIPVEQKFIMDSKDQCKICNPTFIEPIRKALISGLQVGQTVFINYYKGFTMKYVSDNGIAAYFQNI